jgi:hypothetical protein
MDLQKECIARFDKLREHIAALTRLVDILSAGGKKSLNDVAATLPPRESAELHFTLAFSITALYNAHLRCQGTDASKHSISQEEERLKSYISKLTPIVEQAEKRKHVVDVEAAARIVGFHTSAEGNPPYEAKKPRH